MADLPSYGQQLSWTRPKLNIASDKYLSIRPRVMPISPEQYRAALVSASQPPQTSGMPKWFPYVLGVSALAVVGVLFLRKKPARPAPSNP
jgi:hypothetical protein